MSLRQLFRRLRTPKREQRALVLYNWVWEQAQTAAPKLFDGEQNASDEPTRQQRFEVLGSFAVATIAQLKTQGEHPLAQRFHDVFFDQVEASIRQGGVGDPSINKHMKKFIGAFQGRLVAYMPALADSDADVLAVAMERNKVPQPKKLAKTVLAEVTQKNLDTVLDLS